jgi:putative Mn2+ efflux pump MntP
VTTLEETVSILERIASSSPTIAGLVLVVLGCYFIYVKFGKCVECKTVDNLRIELEEKDKLWKGSIGHLETSVQLNKEMKQEMEEVKDELSEHKSIMQNIAETLKGTTTLQNETFKLVNEILIRHKIQNKE